MGLQRLTDPAVQQGNKVHALGKRLSQAAEEEAALREELAKVR